jgi:hypothetical protein
MKATGASAASLVMSNLVLADELQEKKRHIVTLSFDDGFKKSSITTAEIYPAVKSQSQPVGWRREARTSLGLR